MNTFQLIINCSEKNISKNYIIDCVKVPRDSTLSSLLEIFEVFLNNINNNLNTAEKCLHYMFKTSTGSFINNYIDISYKINYINIHTSSPNKSIFNRENENFILEFNQSFEIIRDDWNTYSWRTT